MNNIQLLISTTMHRCRDAKLLNIINIYGIILFSEPGNTNDILLYKSTHSGEMTDSDKSYLYESLKLMLAPYNVRWFYKGEN